MKAFELREMTDDELRVELNDAKAELFNLRFQRESGQLEDLTRARSVRRDIARIMTIIRERELNEEASNA